MLPAGISPGESEGEDNIGFISFSAQNDIASLWGNYAEKFKGACLRFDIPYFTSEGNPNSIENSLQHTSNIMNKCGIEIFYIRRGVDKENGANVIQLHNGDVIVKCRYQEKRFNKIESPSDEEQMKAWITAYNVYSQIAQKDVSWINEKEYRACIRRETTARQNMKFSSLFTPFLRNIIITPNTTLKIDELQELLNSGNIQNKQIEIIEAKFTRDTFSIVLPD